MCSLNHRTIFGSNASNDGTICTLPSAREIAELGCSGVRQESVICPTTRRTMLDPLSRLIRMIDHNSMKV